MSRTGRRRSVDAFQVQQYLDKAEESLLAAQSEMDANRSIAATSLAIHAAINAADAVTGARRGVRAAGTSHDQVLTLLTEAGEDGSDLANHLRRLLTLKTRAQYGPDNIPLSQATKAVDRAGRCVAIARRVAASQP